MFWRGDLSTRVAICHRPSTIFNSCGGIAQLVERQLCKLEVRGSNPLASKADSVETRSNKQVSLSDGWESIPLPPFQKKWRRR